MLALTTTSFGRPALEALQKQIADLKGDDPLAPVTVIVADHTHTTSLRRELARASERGLAAIDFKTLSQLAIELAMDALKTPSGEQRVPLTATVRTALVREVIADDAGIFGPVKEHPATAQAIAEASAKLDAATDDQLSEYAKFDKRAKNVARVHRELSQRAQAEWFTPRQAAVAAADKLNTGTPAPEHTIVHLPAPLRQHQRDLLEALADNSEHDIPVIVAVSTDAQADAPLVDSLSKLGLNLEEVTTPESLAEPQITTTSDADDEVRQIVRHVIDALRAGTPAHRIAVVTAAAEPYNRILAQQLTQAGIEFNGSTGRPVGEFAAASFLERFLRLDLENLTRSDVFALFASAKVRDPNTGETVPDRKWRFRARKHYVNGSAADWIKQLDAAAADYDKAEEDKSDQASTCRSLAAFVKTITDRRNKVESAGTWQELIDLLGAVLSDFVPVSTDSRDEQRADAALRSALREAAIFGQVGIKPSTKELREILQLQTASQQINAGVYGRGVTILSLGQTVGLECDIAIVCGCIEGALPTRPGVDPLLPGRDCGRLRDLGLEINVPAEFVPRQHRGYLAALQSASQQVLLTMPWGDLRKTQVNVPSRWLLETAAKLVGEDHLNPDSFHTTRNERITHVQSFASGIANLAVPASEQEYRLRALTQTNLRKSNDPLLARNIELTDARRSKKFTRFDGNLSGLELPDPLEQPFSASGLEKFIACPHASFMKRLLGVEPLEPDEEDELNALNRGKIIHSVLEKLIEQRFISGDAAADHKWTDEDRVLMRQITDEVVAEYQGNGLTGMPLNWARQRRELDDQLDEFLDKEQKFRLDNGLIPRKVELKFGFEGDGPISIPLGDGRTLLLRGMIDRIDTTADGAVVISDYKSGGTSSFKDITDENPFSGGNLQLPIYALAVVDVVERGEIPGASLEEQSSSGYWFFNDNGKRKEVLLTEENVTTAREIIGKMMDLMRRGIFPQVPAKYCDSCKAFGSDDVERRWSMISDDPALKDFNDLIPVTPEEDEE